MNDNTIQRVKIENSRWRDRTKRTCETDKGMKCQDIQNLHVFNAKEKMVQQRGKIFENQKRLAVTVKRIEADQANNNKSA